MARSLLVLRGPAGVLKTVFLEAQVFRGLASTVPLSAESGKDEKGPPPKPKKQSVPKNVVEPKERGKLPATYPTAALSKSPSPPGSYLAAGSAGRAVAGPHPGSSVPLTDEGDPKPLSRKTLVEFPQKVPLSFQEQGSDSAARQHTRKVTDDSSSSSSSSTSSDSDSDEEGHDSKAAPQVVSKGKGGLSRAEATNPFENAAPQITVSSKEKAKVPKPYIDVTYPEKPQQLKKGTFTKPLEGRKEAQPKPITPSSQSSEESLERSVKPGPLQGKLRSAEQGTESQKPFEVKNISSEHTKASLSAGLSSSPVHTLQPEEARARGQLPASAPGLGRYPEPKVPEPDGKASSPMLRGENLGRKVPEGHVKTKEEMVEGQEPMRNVKTEPSQKKDIFDEKTTGPKLEGRCEATVDAAPHGEAQDHAPVPTQAPAPAQPFDNTSYKNLQHHDYNTYTFLDVNLDLSKFRMPQPSSGRESPRH